MTISNGPVRILDLTPEQLDDFLVSLGEKPAVARALLKNIFHQGLSDFLDMESIGLPLRQKLKEQAVLAEPLVLDERVSSDEQTRKVLLELEDGRTVESALMLFRNSATGRERSTVCLSSQVGCAIGCRFCATGRQGFERNLTPGEILHQALYFKRRFGQNGPPASGSRGWPTNVVFMGMGEPLNNYDNVCRAIALLNSPFGLGLGFHQVTLSTAGLAPQIRRLAGEKLQFQLAVSLHAANDALRDRLVPVNRKYPLAELVAACRDFAAETGRKIFIEYALFDGINDSAEDADELLDLLQGLDCSINLIAGNQTASADFKPTSGAAAHAFQKRLIAGGFRTMLRVPRGQDIDAGCGQLKSGWLAEKEES